MSGPEPNDMITYSLDLVEDPTLKVDEALRAVPGLPHIFQGLQVHLEVGCLILGIQVTKLLLTRGKIRNDEVDLRNVNYVSSE